MKSIQHQKGMTAIGWLLVIAMAVFILLIGIRLVPVYLNQFNVSAVVSSLENEPGIVSMSSGDISGLILKRFDINMVKDVQANDIYISQQGNMRFIEVDYEVQRKLIANIDILIRFQNKAEVPIR